jgi:hypothetical protein
MLAEIVYSLAFGSPDHRWCESPVSVSVSNTVFDTHLFLAALLASCPRLG